MTTPQASQLHPVRRAIRAAIDEGLLPNGACVVVACSGGPDSLALLHGLRSFEGELRLHVAHLDHGVRGPDDTADAEFVRDLARSWGLPVTIGTAQVAAQLRPGDSSVELVGRRERYRFLGGVARATGAEHIAVAHTADDQLETMVMRFIRGTGPGGLAGIAPSQRLDSLTGGPFQIVRPLLGIGRPAILEYLRHHDLAYRIDATNAEPAVLRNRVRNSIVPLLRAENPEVAAAAARLATTLRELSGYLAVEARRVWDSVALPSNGVAMDRRALTGLPPALRAEVLRLAGERLFGHPNPLEWRHIDALNSLAEKGKPRRMPVIAGLMAEIHGGTLVLDFPRQRTAAPAATLRPNGAIGFDEWTIQARRLVPRDIKETTSPFGVWIADCEELGVRPWRSGDRYAPVGLGGTRKLSDLFTEAKIPRGDRKRLPVIEADGKIVWPVGFRIAEWAKVPPDAASALWLSAVRTDGGATVENSHADCIP